MKRLEGVIPGCGHYDTSRGICRMMHQGNAVPSLAKETQVSPPGEIEGSGMRMVMGLICLSANAPEKQIDCSDFVPRTEQDNDDDYSW
jgi:hypothetical protein